MAFEEPIFINSSLDNDFWIFFLLFWAQIIVRHSCENQNQSVKVWKIHIKYTTCIGANSNRINKFCVLFLLLCCENCQRFIQKKFSSGTMSFDFFSFFIIPFYSELHKRDKMNSFNYVILAYKINQRAIESIQFFWFFFACVTNRTSTIQMKKITSQRNHFLFPFTLKFVNSGIVVFTFQMPEMRTNINTIIRAFTLNWSITFNQVYFIEVSASYLFSLYSNALQTYFS